jgi:Cu+-exporting ATPase
LAYDAGGGGPVRFLEARLLLSAFLSVGLMEFSMALYGGAVYGAEQDEGLRLVEAAGRLILPLLAVPVLALLGWPMLCGALRDLRGGVVRLDGLVALGTFAAFALSFWNTFVGGGEVYYETAAMVLVLVAFGRRLEARSRQHARSAAEAVAALLPEVARRRNPDGTIEEVSPRTLAKGDVVLIAPGARVPADVCVLDGMSDVVSEHLTGEEAARAVHAGDAVDAGAINGKGQLTATVTAATAEGSLARVLRLLEAPLPSTRLLRLTDRLSSWLALVAVVLAAVAAARGYSVGGRDEALRAALAVLLVACPCALGLAIPLAFHALRTRLVGKGVLVEEAVALEVLPVIDTVVFDKTGTLSDPARMRVAAWGGVFAASRRLSALVRASGHSLGRAFEVDLPCNSLEAIPGCGVRGEVEGVPVIAGHRAWVLASLPALPRSSAEQALLAAATNAEAEGGSVIVSAEGGRIAAFAAVVQELRPSASSAIAALRARGVRVLILSGDRKANVEALGRLLGVAAEGELRPEEKLARVAALRAAGARVLVVGDGVNDAPMLRHADVGVAMECGSATARNEAQVSMLHGDLMGVALLFAAAQKLRSTVRGNLFWTLFYNGAAMVLAVLGLVHPLIAAAAMVFSSLAVSWRSTRLLQAEFAP